MNIIYLTFLLLLTAVLSSIITSSLPALKHVFKRVLQRSKRKSPKVSIADLEARINTLEHNLDNVAEVVARREKNMKSKVRTEVNNYLTQLKND